MIAGTLAIINEPADEVLESESSGGFATLDVRETQQCLDESIVQQGRACAKVEGQNEEIHVTGTTIDTESVPGLERAYTEWVADVTDAGFIASERTTGEAFPFDMFEAALGTDVDRAELDPSEFVDAQRRADNDIELWMSGSKAKTSNEEEPDDVSIGYGQDSTQAGGNVGVGFRTSWQGRRVRGVLYASGYVALFNSWVGEIAYAQFVREEVLPHASVPEDDEADDGGQTTLDEDTDDSADEVCGCGREADHVVDGKCAVCRDLEAEQEEEAAYDRLETVTMSDGGDDDGE